MVLREAVAAHNIVAVAELTITAALAAVAKVLLCLVSQ
jgi:hypothetical protein